MCHTVTKSPCVVGAGMSRGVCRLAGRSLAGGTGFAPGSALLCLTRLLVMKPDFKCNKPSAASQRSAGALTPCFTLCKTSAVVLDAFWAEGLSLSALQLKGFWLWQEVGGAPEPQGDTRAGGGLSSGRGKGGKASTGRKRLPPCPLPSSFSGLLKLSAPLQGFPHFAAEEPSPGDNGERIN